MQPRRTHLLLLLLVITPLALLTWLGTYLIRDAARSTEAAMHAVLTERLAVADHQLTDELRRFTEELDQTLPSTEAASTAQALATHAGVVQTWVAGLDLPAQIVFGKEEVGEDIRARTQALLSILSLPLASAITAYEPFYPIAEHAPIQMAGQSRQAIWMTFARNDSYRLAGLVQHVNPVQFPSGWHVTDGDFIYWRLTRLRELICARFDSQKIRQALYSRLPPPGLQSYAGRLSLTTRSGISLYSTGRGLPGAEDTPTSTCNCSAPLTQWVLAYSPADSEFPQPYLFPILLGVGSGCLLVVALAWIFFRENARELRLAQQRVSFVNQISHELRTPLTNIQLYTEMAAHRLEDSGDTIAQRHLRVVETETARLNRLIQNVLNYARQQRDKLSVQARPLVLDEVVSRAVGNWRILLENKGFKIQLSLKGPPLIQADADAVEQILGNLLSNVDKYAAHGKWVSVSTRVEGDMAQVLVEDRGPGIPSGKRGIIFEPFERLRSDLNEGVSGTGIGLTISRELADLHGGSLEVCSQTKDGAKFILSLPIKTL
jgi:signal transduction histidine kinase